MPPKNAEPRPVDRTERGRCAPEGTRTPNLLIRSQMLYPLSYGRIAVWLTPTVRVRRGRIQTGEWGFDHTGGAALIMALASSREAPRAGPSDCAPAPREWALRTAGPRAAIDATGSVS